MASMVKTCCPGGPSGPAQAQLCHSGLGARSARLLESSRAHRQSSAVLRADRAGPDHVKVPRRKQRVPAPDVAQDRGLKFRPAASKALPIDFVPQNSSSSLGMFNNYHQHNKARTGKGAAQAVSHARTNLFLIGTEKDDEPG